MKSLRDTLLSLLSFPAVVVALVVTAPLPVWGQAGAEPGAKPRFDVMEFQVNGNTVLPTEVVERAVYPFLGEKKTIEDVEAARTALEQVYRDRGYGTVLVGIPEQRVAGGLVLLQVVQGEVSRLRVVGAHYYSQGRILDQVPGLAEGQVPYFPAVQAELAGVNRSPDRRVTPLLRPGKRPGTTEVDLNVEDRLPLHGSLEINNRYSPNTSHPRLMAALRYDNLWQRQHSVGVQYQTSPRNTSEVKVLSGTYSMPAGNGLVVFSAIDSNSSVVAGVGDVNVFGRGRIYGVRGIVPLESGDAKLAQSLTVGADYKDFKENVTVGATGGFQTPIRYVPFSLSYAATRDTDSGRWLYGAGLIFSLRGLRHNQAQFDDKRFRAQNNFAIVKLDLAREQKLLAGFALFARIDGQISSQPLISNEQFVVGGVDSVRGYLDASVVGDSGARASVELRTPSVAGGEAGWLKELRFHTFADGATLRLRSPLPGQQSRFELFGVGIGLRAHAIRGFGLALDLAWPLRDTAFTRSGQAHLHASGTLEF